MFASCSKGRMIGACVRVRVDTQMSCLSKLDLSWTDLTANETVVELKLVGNLRKRQKNTHSHNNSVV